MKHLSAIDGLRAIAVLAVVAYHAGLPVPAGFVGVDVFFAISGYLITRLLHDEVQAAGRIDFLAFYARRARRILPALIVIIIATLALSALLLRPAATVGVGQSAAAASVFVANVFFQAHAGGYWSEDSGAMPLLHLWSLSVEEQFYLLWPLVLILARRKPVAALVIIALGSMGLAEYWLWWNPEAAFYEMPARAWELAIGGLIALRPLRVPRGSTWAGLAAVIFACFVPFSHFPGAGGLPAVLGAALVIAAAQGGEQPCVLTNRLMGGIGLISYSLYLWHWPLLAIDHAMGNGASPLGTRLCIVGVGFVLAAASYRYVETPFRRMRGGAKRIVIAGLAALAVLTCSAFVMASRPVPFDAAARAATDFPVNRFTCHQQALGPPTALAAACQNRPGTPDVVMWGDSMALAWQPYAYAQHGIAADYSRDACPAFDPGDDTARKQWCRAFNSLVVPRAQAAHTVILAGRWTSYASVDGLEDVLRSLPRHRVIILGPTPTLPAGVPDCIGKHDLQPCTLARSSFDSQAAPVRTKLRALAHRYGAEYVEPAEFFCSSLACPAVRNGIPLYWDRDHISTTAATAFARQVR